MRGWIGLGLVDSPLVIILLVLMFLNSVSDFLIVISPVIGAVFLVERYLDSSVRERIANYLFGIEPLPVRGFELDLIHAWVNSFFYPAGRFRFRRIFLYSLSVGFLFLIFFVLMSNSGLSSSSRISDFLTAFWGYSEILGLLGFLFDDLLTAYIGMQLVLVLAVLSLPFDFLNFAVGKIVYSSDRLPSNLALKLGLDLILSVLFSLFLWVSIFFALSLFSGLVMSKVETGDQLSYPPIEDVIKFEGRDVVVITEVPEPLRFAWQDTPVPAINSLFVNGYPNPVPTFPAALAWAFGYSAIVSLIIYFSARFLVLTFGVAYRFFAYYSSLNFWLIGFTTLHKIPLTFLSLVFLILMSLGIFLLHNLSQFINAIP